MGNLLKFTKGQFMNSNPVDQFGQYVKPQIFQPTNQCANKYKHVQSKDMEKYIGLKQLKPSGIYEFGSGKILDPNKQFGIYKLPSELTILTYNIWFENYNLQNRQKCILSLLKDSQADFICLQEVTGSFMNRLHSCGKNSWLKDYYMGVIDMRWYDTLILSKYKCRFYKVPFQNSTMSRCMLLAELAVQNGENVVVGSMHFQSLNNPQIRMEQMQKVFHTVKDIKRVIIAGDFNFSDNYPENKQIPSDFRDLWIQAKGNLNNSQTMPKTIKFPVWRPDHIIYSTKDDLKGIQITKIGDFTITPHQKEKVEAIQTDGVVRTPSDHFGLFARIPIQHN